MEGSECSCRRDLINCPAAAIAHFGIPSLGCCAVEISIVSFNRWRIRIRSVAAAREAIEGRGSAARRYLEHRPCRYRAALVRSAVEVAIGTERHAALGERAIVVAAGEVVYDLQLPRRCDLEYGPAAGASCGRGAVQIAVPALGNDA